MNKAKNLDSIFKFLCIYSGEVKCFVIIKKGEIVNFNFDDDECKTSMKRYKVVNLFISGFNALKRGYKSRRLGVIGIEGIVIRVEVLIQNAVSIRC